MFLLAVSLVTLALGPVLYRLSLRARGALAALDGFVLIAIVGLVVVHILPDAIEAAGFGAVGAALLGLVGPGLIERSLHRAARQAHLAAVGVVVVGINIHGFFDGIALTGANPDGGLLGIAVVIHRLPVAITLWSVLSLSRGGPRLATAVLAALGASTVAGFVASDQFADQLNETWLGYLQSLVAGSVLHVVFHRTHGEDALATGRWRIYAGLGAVAALGLVIALSETHFPLHAGTKGMAVGTAFLTLALESAPALLIAFAMAGLAQVFLPSTALTWMTTGRPATEAVRGMLFGLPLPICSCGVIPLYQSLVQQHVPATAAIAFLVATPELGIDAVLISLPLLGAELTLARVAAAVAVAFLAGWLIGRLVAPAPPRTPPAAATTVARERLGARLRMGLRYGLADIVDHIGPWILLGLAIAAFVEPMLDTERLAALPAGVDVPLFALLGMPSYVCASGATPLVAILIHKGVSPGAALAFLLTGPATNVTTFGILARLHGRRVALVFGATVAATSIGLGYIANLVLSAGGGIELYEVAEAGPSVVEVTSLAVLGVIFLASLLRQGPRGFIAQILMPYGRSDHDHDHDRGHGDGHGRSGDHRADDCC